MTDALNLTALESCFNILQVEQEDRAELGRRLILIHSVVMQERRRKMRKPGDA